MREIKQNEPFETDYFINYYDTYRRSVTDLFPSERYFIDDLINRNSTIFDLGCASGGMSEIVKKLNKSCDYVGGDISQALIDEAKQRYTDAKFHLVDGVNLNFSDRSFDAVLSFGTCVHEQEWCHLLREAWRVCKNELLFDIRLVQDLPTVSNISDGFVRDGTDMRYPYVVVNFDEFMDFVGTLDPKPAAVNYYGYYGSPNKDVSLPMEYKNICMTGVLLQKDFTETFKRPIVKFPF